MVLNRLVVEIDCNEYDFLGTFCPFDGEEGALVDRCPPGIPYNVTFKTHCTFFVIIVDQVHDELFETRKCFIVEHVFPYLFCLTVIA
jgi:hypothetical protein